MSRPSYTSYGGSQKTTRVFMGIDPGLANTGIAICKVRGNRVTVVHLERFVTKKGQPDRVNMIKDRLRELAFQYKVDYCICEAFEVRSWSKAMNSGAAMSKLINSISEVFFELSVPFLLSSPDKKRGMNMENIPEQASSIIMSRPKTHREHLFDAYIHVFKYAKRGVS